MKPRSSGAARVGCGALEVKGVGADGDRASYKSSSRSSPLLSREET